MEGFMISADRIDTRIRFDAPDPFVLRPLAIRIAKDGVTLTVPSKSISLVELF
jgi:alpha-L-arabinofuranosidase